MLTEKDFEQKGYWTDTTEENITVYGKDLPDGGFQLVTDPDGNTPSDPKSSLILATYDSRGAFVKFQELKNFSELK